MKRSVALIIHNGVQALDLAGPMDVFAEANALLPNRDGYECRILCPTPGPIQASNGMTLMPDAILSQTSQWFETVLVAGGPAMPDAGEDPVLSAWLQKWGVTAARYGSICTGAFALGHAGLLDGRTVTTHWQNAAKLAASFPNARVEFDRIHARDGALVTSAGVTAGIDLALSLVAEDHGDALALACAKRLVVVAQRQGGQSQFSPLLIAHGAAGTTIGKIKTYVADHLREPLPVRRLAEIAGISMRSIARLFITELGITPHDFVEGVRLDQARNLLEASDQSMKAVAFACGFGNPEQMRTAFQRRLGLTPSRYRDSFRSTWKH